MLSSVKIVGNLEKKNGKNVNCGLFVIFRCFLFADMPWYQRKIASALFATPPTSTYEEVMVPE